MRSLWMIYGVLFGCMLSCNRGVMAQDLRVLVLDALDGKPQANVQVEYFCTRTQHNSAHKKALTSKDGSARFSNPCSAEEEIEISIYPPNKKEQCGVGSVTLKEILSVGVVAQPDLRRRDLRRLIWQMSLKLVSASLKGRGSRILLMWPQAFQGLKLLSAILLTA